MTVLPAVSVDDLAALLDAALGIILLLTQAGRIIYGSPPSTGLGQHGKLFRVEAGVLHTNRENEDQALHHAMASLAAGREADTVCLRSREGFVVAILDMQLLTGRGLVALRITNMEVSPTDSATRFGRVFGLTRAEASVTASLLAGNSLAEIAKLHGTGIETVRTQIKRVRGKTGVDSQIQLMGILARADAARAL